VDNYIKRLITEGEHQTLDFKFEISDTKKIARSLVAFANTDGGRLLVGVKDNGNITGIKSDEEAYMIETAALLYCKPEVHFITNNHNTEGKNVLEVVVEPSNSKPHRAPGKNDKWTAYIRVKDENQIANRVIIKVWERETQQGGIFLKYTESEKRLLSYIEQNGEITFSKACKVAKASHSKIENMLANFISLGIIEAQFDKNRIIYQIKSAGNFTY
jgi:predicted HTH transcriptional regulator